MWICELGSSRKACYKMWQRGLIVYYAWHEVAAQLKTSHQGLMRTRVNPLAFHLMTPCEVLNTYRTVSLMLKTITDN